MGHWIQKDLEFIEDTHEYIYNSKSIVSVTSLFDRIGIRDNDQSPWNPLGCPDFAKKEQDREFGSAFHKIAAAKINGLKVSYPEEMEPYVCNLMKFIDDQGFRPMADSNGNNLVEYPLYSIKHNYCGALDAFGYNWKLEYLLVDWKTSRTYNKCFGWQTSAYEKLVKEVFGIRNNTKIKRVTVLIGTDGYQEYWRANRPEDYIVFQSLLNIYKTLKGV